MNVLHASILVYVNLGEDSSCLCRYLKILFLPTILLESKLSRFARLSRSELKGKPKLPEVLAFFIYRLLPNSYLSRYYYDGSL